MSSRPTGIHDLLQGGFAMEQLVGLVDEERRMQTVDDAIDVRAGQLDCGISPRHQEAEDAEQGVFPYQVLRSSRSKWENAPRSRVPKRT